jgi:hypothetical protein
MTKTYVLIRAPISTRMIKIVGEKAFKFKASEELNSFNLVLGSGYCL